MKLTKERAIELHRKLWDWLAKNPGKRKEDWPGWAWNNGPHRGVYANCFTCQYAIDNAGPYDDLCSTCVLEWPRNKDCFEPASLFQKWHDATDLRRLKTAARLAAQIRDLPEGKRSAS